MSRRIRIAAAAAGLAVAAGVLTGCSLIEAPVRDLVDQAQEANPLGSVPSDFPSEVPLVEGDVLVGLTPTEGTWSVTIGVADEAAAEQSVTLLEDAGFVELVEGSKTFTSDAYNVVVQWASVDGGGVGVAYVVTAK